MVVGVLALQGDFAEHVAVLRSLSVDTKEVRTVSDFSVCDALIIPGGESTVMMKLLRESGLDKEIIRHVRDGMPVFGTCAGAILLSDSHLKLMDISVERNAYGRQTDSFAREIDMPFGSINVAFIRAPIITRAGGDTEILAEESTHPVLVRQGNMLAATFHTEISGESAVHELFVSSCRVLQK